MSAPKLAEIAARITAHLRKIEAETPRPTGKQISMYWHAHSYVAGSRVAVSYVSYQHTTKLRKADALEYLAWLDAGNVGRHYGVLGFNARIWEAAR